jgi:hypothetical protein
MLALDELEAEAPIVTSPTVAVVGERAPRALPSDHHLGNS